MVQPQSNPHLEKKHDGEALEGLGVTGEKSHRQRAKSEKKQKARARAHTAFIDHGFTGNEAICVPNAGEIRLRRHRPTIPQGV